MRRGDQEGRPGGRERNGTGSGEAGTGARSAYLVCSWFPAARRGAGRHPGGGAPGPIRELNEVGMLCRLALSPVSYGSSSASALAVSSSRDDAALPMFAIFASTGCCSSFFRPVNSPLMQGEWRGWQPPAVMYRGGWPVTVPLPGLSRDRVS